MSLLRVLVLSAGQTRNRERRDRASTWNPLWSKWLWSFYF